MILAPMQPMEVKVVYNCEGLKIRECYGFPVTCTLKLTFLMDYSRDSTSDLEPVLPLQDTTCSSQFHKLRQKI